MFESASPQNARSRAPRIIAFAGAMTLLGYYGLPWWFGWPALKTLDLLASEKRSVTMQTLVFALAVLVNVGVWAIVFIALAPVVRRAHVPRRPAVIAVAGLMTILGYYGLPWWFGWPAQMTLQLFAFSERPAAIQAVIFVAAVLLNVAVWTFLIAALLRLRERANVRDHVANLFRRQ